MPIFVSGHKQVWRVAARSLWKTPTFTATATCLLALAVTANTTMFSFVDAIFLSALPYGEAERLVVIQQRDARPKCEAGCEWAVAPNAFSDWSSQMRVDATTAALEVVQATMASPERTELLQGAAVSADFFATLRLNAAIGRTLDSSDDRADSDDAVVVGHQFWVSRLGSDPAAVGRSVTLGGRSYRVVGVLPIGADVGRPIFSADDITPLFFVSATPYAIREAPKLHLSSVFARLNHGIELRAFQARVQSVLERSRNVDPRSTLPVGGTGWEANVISLRRAISNVYSPSFRIVLVAVPFVSFIALANLAGLFLARLAVRDRELRIRRILGARRRDIVVQWVVEAALLCTGGGIVGILLSFWSVRLATIIPTQVLPYWAVISVTPSALMFGSGFALAAIAIFGLVPALIVTREPYKGGLGAVSATATTASKIILARHAALTIQLALTLVILTAAGLVESTYFGAMSRDIGLSRTAVIRGSLMGDASVISSPEQRLEFATGLQQRLARIPGIDASAVSGSPATDAFDGTTREGDDRILAAGLGPTSAESISSDEFRVLGVRIVSGRPFSVADVAGSRAVAILDEPTAQHIFPQGTAIGRRVKLGPPSSPEPWMTVVGVSAATRSLFSSPPYRPNMFRPLAQAPPTPTLNFAVRVRGVTDASLAGVSEAVHNFSPLAAVAGLTTVEAREGQMLAPLRLNAILIGGLAFFCSLIAAVGIYGVVAFGAEQMRREIAIRLALGAQRTAILSVAMRRMTAIASVAVGLGLAGSLAATRVIGAILYGAGTTNWMILMAASTSLILVALAAALVPAWKATSIDPTLAVRPE
jgi:putative ABC transport system permease protein